MSDLFRFEVPTSQGVFVIIGPDTLPADEARRVGEQIGKLIPLLLNEPELEPEPAELEPQEVDPEHNPGWVMGPGDDMPWQREAAT